VEDGEEAVTAAAQGLMEAETVVAATTSAYVVRTVAAAVAGVAPLLELLLLRTLVLEGVQLMVEVDRAAIVLIEEEVVAVGEFFTPLVTVLLFAVVKCNHIVPSSCGGI
jgi:hypothetical protein